MINKFFNTAIVGLMMIASNAVNAGLISFDLMSGDNQGSLNFTSDTQTVTVTGFKWDDTVSAYVSANVIANHNGLGVVGGGSANRIGAVLASDGSSKGDYLLFTFSNAFNSFDIDFANSNGNVNFNLGEAASITTLFNGVLVNSYSSVIADGTNQWSSASGGLANQISIAALTGISGVKNGFKLNNITFNTLEPATVPEPGTIAIFALGMIGLVARKFKK